MGQSEMVLQHPSASPETFIRQFYIQYGELDAEEKRLLLLNLHAQLKQTQKHGHDCSHTDHLTSREKEVLVLIANGYCRREVAVCLNISINTASRHISNIYTKLGINTVAEATRIAIENNLTSTS